MVIEELYDILRKNDIVLSPDYTISEGLVYQFSDITNDKVKIQSRFDVTIIYKDLLKCHMIKEKIDNILLTFGDEPLTPNILSVKQNGGGVYWDADLNLRKVKVNYVVTHRA